MDQPKPYPGDKSFFFGTPLYAKVSLSNDMAILTGGGTVDGHCPFCGMSSTFMGAGKVDFLDLVKIANGELQRDVEIVLRCARNIKDHTLTYYLRLADNTIEKIGQFPSLADIALDASKQYRAELGSYSSEFHKAIGLAAHGVGIGSYVYLRRIFEHLIWDRFQEFKDIEGWSEEQFRLLRMDQKIELLNAHLPDFMVENRKVYGILSLGIHELDEDECLSFFDVLKSSTIIILEEDKEKREKVALREQLQRAVAEFSPEKSKNENTVSNREAQ